MLSQEEEELRLSGRKELREEQKLKFAETIVSMAFWSAR